MIDRRGRQKTVARNGITTTLTYNDANQLIGESYSGGTLNALAVTPAYDVHLRRESLSLNTSPALNFSYGYDTASRLQTVGDGLNPANSATYSYLPNSTLVGTIEFKQGTELRMTTTRQYDKLNRLSSIASLGSQATAAGVSPLSFSYVYNDANQRVRAPQFDNTQWVYKYDKLGQVISGKKYWNDGTPVAGQQFEYVFDDIGNRTSTKVGGDSGGANLRSATYTVNALNQYSQRTVPNALDALGLVKATTASVTINTSPADYRRGEYFQETLSFANSAQAVWQSVTVDPGVPADVKTGNIFIPKTPEIFDDASTPTVNEGYDLDGNQLRDGRWTYTWDAENRLVRMVANTLIGPQQRIDFEYDWQGRRIRKKVWNNIAGTDPVAVDQKFLYDGWNLVAVLAPDNSRLQSFTWGYDLSGTLQGAGGVGGLKAVTVHAGPEAGTYFYAYDGNGNVAGLVSAASGGIAAQYEYAPFGEPIRITGPMGKVNPFRFSTKYTDDETDFVYYGYRYYTASTGRWLTRDPIEEFNGPNVYAFVWGNPFSWFDFLGLAAADCCCTVTLLIEVPGPNVQGKLNRKGLGGHTGIAVENEYYDYGPQPGRGASILGSPGRPWWDRFPEVNPSGNASLQDILSNLDELSDQNDTYTVTAEVSQSECARVRNYWDELYDEPGTYRFYGRQCTTTACTSLRKAGLIQGRALKPQTFLTLVRNNLKHTCGNKKGKPADVTQVHFGSASQLPAQGQTP